MNIIKDKQYGGERPLFETHGARLENIVITDGESAIKHCSDLEVVGCKFFGKYPLWHVDRCRIENCYFAPEARSAIWYTNDLEMRDCTIDGPKFFREMHNVTLEKVVINDADEVFWNVDSLKLKDITVGKAYKAKLKATGSKTLEFFTSGDATAKLKEYGLTLAKDGSLSGTCFRLPERPQNWETQKWGSA